VISWKCRLTSRVCC